MGFEQDPSEQANISGADLAIMVDEMQKQKALIEQLGEAMVEAWPSIGTRDFTGGKRITSAMFAYRDYAGASGSLPRLAVGSFNPWDDTIVIEGVTYKGDFFRKQQIFNEG